LSRIDVQKGDEVTLGQTIGLSGGAGCVVDDALHFEVGSSNGVDPIVLDPYGWEADGADPWPGGRQGLESFWMWLPGKAPRIQ
jgi:murein DD-endopeptidase MepM/ murein hydrolase activator NlpD